MKLPLDFPLPLPFPFPEYGREWEILAGDDGEGEREFDRPRELVLSRDLTRRDEVFSTVVGGAAAFSTGPAFSIRVEAVS